MADPDAETSWMLDDDVVDETVVAADGEEEVSETTVSGKPVEVPKPPAEWRKTYKLDVSNINTTARFFCIMSNLEVTCRL